MPRITCSAHYKQRFDERVTRKSKRLEVFAARAYHYGDGLDDISDKRLRYYIESKEKAYGSVARIYHGFIYWFSECTVTTIHPVPRVFRGVI